MNISTGGPHILLFERDQQLATLLVSELQLAGYTNHTARTAVEVFDTIARYPIRLVLVNLAQAAAARREFWVALDSQRRDRKVQVLTFLCTNLASYGPRDFEDRSSNTMADIEVDGMMGLMSLVEAVRTRVPGDNVEATTNTLPRLPKMSPTPSSSMATRSQQQPGSGGMAASYRSTADTDNQQARAYMTTPLSPTTTNNGFASQAQSTTSITNNNNSTNNNEYAAPASTNAATPTYTEKIRAVLYPNQRTWSAQGTNNYTMQQENKEAPATYNQRSYAPPGPSDSALQRLAGGQINDSTDESGLAQLSRMAQGYRSPFREENNNGNSNMYTSADQLAQPAPMRTPANNTMYQPAETAQPAPTRTPATNTIYTSADQIVQPTPLRTSATNTMYTTADQVMQRTPANNTMYQPIETTQPASIHTPATNTMYQSIETPQPSGPRPTPSTMTPIPPTPTETDEQHSTTSNIHTERSNNINGSFTVYVSPSSLPPQANGDTGPQAKINAQTLRASPIQDMPIERTVTGPAVTENTRRPDVLSRANYGQQLAQIAQQLQAIQQTQSTSPPATSITSPMPPVTPVPVNRAAPTPPIQEKTPPKAKEETSEKQDAEEPIEYGKEQQNHSEVKQASAESKLGIDFEEGLTANNAVLLDIVQSLPPMPALSEQPQSVQPQVLSGRATRSLGKVLLDGHLVPHDRLEVAQNIQRMLRGVDLNYQLGEILLMFKLLTPDQLLAASLVSYGLITTTQISALGRIRQELHSIGLEYDLENLLILFRILTPEQLREVRASLQS